MNKNWDVIIIGSGLAGLSAAATLTKLKRKKVLVIEQHYKAGGYATNFKRKDFTFDVSLHQLPSLGKGQVLNKILTKLDVMTQITPIELEETLKIKTLRGDLSMGKEFLNDLRNMFPEEKKALDKIEDIVVKLLREVKSVFLFSFLPDYIYKSFVKIFAPTIYKYHKKSLEDCLNEFTSNNQLKQLIAIQWGYFGLPLKEISSIMYFIGWGGFLKEGIYYIKGTSQKLSNAFVETIKNNGGDIILKHITDEILIDNNKTKGVKIKNLRTNEMVEYYAPVIISNADPFSTFNKMIKKQDSIPDVLKKQLNELDISCSATVAYIGLDCSFEQMTGEKAHSLVFINEDTDFDKEFSKQKLGTLEGFSGFINYTAMDDSLCPKGKSVLSIIRNEFMIGWDNMNKSEYYKKKEILKEELLIEMDKKYQGFSSHVEVIEIGTPKTMERYTSNYGGAFNGFAYNKKRVGLCNGGLKSKTPIQGLYLASAWVGPLSGGFYGSIINGFSVANSIK